MGQKKYIIIPKKDIKLDSKIGFLETRKFQKDWKLRIPSESNEFDVKDNDECEESSSVRNKHDNILIRKKFKKSINYRCCGACIGNPGKFAGGYCCTYPQVYRRRDVTVQNRIFCRQMDDDIYLE